MVAIIYVFIRLNCDKPSKLIAASLMSYFQWTLMLTSLFMDAALVCDGFIAACGELQRNVSRVEEGVNTVANELGGRCSEQRHNIEELQLKNQILRNKVDKEEEWMRRVAIDILDSEEESVAICLEAIWHLSENCANCTEIVHSDVAMQSIMDIMASEKSSRLIECCLGIYSNILRGRDSRSVLMKEYGGEYVTNIVLMAQQLIERCVLHFDKKLELSVILLFNLTLCESGPTYILNNWVVKTLVDALERHKENENLCALIASILDLVFDDQQADRMMFLTFDLANRIDHSLSMMSATVQMINLRTKLRLVFPGL